MPTLAFASFRKGLSSALVGAVLIGISCVARAETPRNLYYVKQELRAYAKGPYLAEVQAVAKQVEEWLVERSKAAKSGERLLIVFDLDETIYDVRFDAFDEAPLKLLDPIARRNRRCVLFSEKRDEPAIGAQKSCANLLRGPRRVPNRQ